MGAFVSEMKKYFGYRQGDGIKEFSAELKALSHEEKMEFAQMLRGQGIDCEDPKPPQTA